MFHGGHCISPPEGAGKTFRLPGGTAAAAGVRPLSQAAQAAPSPSKLPRRRGFNLLAKFIFNKSGNGPFQESDFEAMAQWGFDFVRLPREPQLPLRPGYCVNPPKEARDLWTDPGIQDQFGRHWAFFARRCKGIPSRRVSFDLVNEPAGTDNAKYAVVVENAIRAEDPQRLVIADGNQWGTKPVPEIAPLKVGQSKRGYQHTPHKVVLAWMKDMLDNWRKAGWGWSLWNFRGAFGVLDSGRKDLAYEDFKGRKLDKAMLEVLRAG